MLYVCTTANIGTYMLYDQWDDLEIYDYYYTRDGYVWNIC